MLSLLPLMFQTFASFIYQRAYFFREVAGGVLAWIALLLCVARILWHGAGFLLSWQSDWVSNWLWVFHRKLKTLFSCLYDIYSNSFRKLHVLLKFTYEVLFLYFAVLTIVPREEISPTGSFLHKWGSAISKEPWCMCALVNYLADVRILCGSWILCRSWTQIYKGGSESKMTFLGNFLNGSIRLHDQTGVSIIPSLTCNSNTRSFPHSISDRSFSYNFFLFSNYDPMIFFLFDTLIKSFLKVAVSAE